MIASQTQTKAQGLVVVSGPKPAQIKMQAKLGSSRAHGAPNCHYFQFKHYLQQSCSHLRIRNDSLFYCAGPRAPPLRTASISASRRSATRTLVRSSQLLNQSF